MESTTEQINNSLERFMEQLTKKEKKAENEKERENLESNKNQEEGSIGSKRSVTSELEDSNQDNDGDQQGRRKSPRRNGKGNMDKTGIAENNSKVIAISKSGGVLPTPGTT